MQSTRTIVARALGLLVPTLAGGSLALGDVSAFASANLVEHSDQGGYLTFSASATAADSFTTPGFSGPGSINTLSASSAARAVHGGIRATASASSTGSHSFAGIGSTATASFSDLVTISTTAPITQGTFSALVWISGSVSADAPGSAAASASVSVQSSLGSDDASVSLDHAGNTSTSGYHLIQVPFVLGQPFTVSGNTSVSANGFSDFLEGGSSAFADFSGTLNWGGITEVRDDAGALIQDWDVVSASGADYRDEIIPPEIPAPGGLGAFGLILSAGAIRRRSRSEVSSEGRVGS